MPINEIRKCRNLMAQNEIRFRLELTIESSKIVECKKLIQDMVKVVEANEPDTIITSITLIMLRQAAL